MLDLHGITDTTGVTGGEADGAWIVAAGGDGATNPGVPIKPNAKLVMWAAATAIADTWEQVRFVSNDQPDSVTGENFELGAASLAGLIISNSGLMYRNGQRRFRIDQNTAAADCLVAMLDYYPGGAAVAMKKWQPNKVVQNQTFGGALTALTWGTQAFAPAINLPAGTYAIHGAWVNALTNYGNVRFAHADFGEYRPGFPVADMTNTAVANAVLPKDEIVLQQGYQFDYLSELLGVPCCPVFRATSSGTGLQIQALSVTGDTPRVVLNLSKIA